MFTDVVGFSKHSAINEERTFRALNRDFDIIYRQVAAHGGQVLNTMGDGMMIVFMSAISCVQCALSIQGDLHRQALSRPADGVLQHRIGLHIGDILLNGKNTMGDGVNQAARIESLARPDSIAMSREFFRMVEGKTPFTSKYLGPLRAKNIPEAIPIHEIPPIDDIIRQKTAEALFTPPPSEISQGATGRRGALFLAAAVILILAAAAPIFLLKAAQKSAGQLALENGRAFGPGSGAKEAAENWKKRMERNKVANNAPEANNPAANNEETTNSISLTPEQLANIAAKTNNYDYAGVAAELRTIPGSNSNEGLVMIKKYETLIQFKSWLDSEVGLTTETAPIDATIDGSAVKVYSTPAGIVITHSDGQMTTKKLWEYTASTIQGIAEAISVKPPDSSLGTADISTWIGTFKEVHGLK